RGRLSTRPGGRAAQTPETARMDTEGTEPEAAERDLAPDPRHLRVGDAALLRGAARGALRGDGGAATGPAGAGTPPGVRRRPRTGARQPGEGGRGRQPRALTPAAVGRGPAAAVEFTGDPARPLRAGTHGRTVRHAHPAVAEPARRAGVSRAG